MKITISKENYLKAIAEAESEGEPVIAATLARWLNVSAPAVTMAVKRLKRDALIRVNKDGQVSLTAAGREIPVTRMFAVRGERAEPVTYWFTMGDRVVRGRLERLQVQVENGLAGRIPDGMLVRVSSLSADAPRAYAAQDAFLSAVVAAIPAADAARIVGAG